MTGLKKTLMGNVPLISISPPPPHTKEAFKLLLFKNQGLGGGGVEGTTRQLLATVSEIQ